jgi:hypothetical protein
MSNALAVIITISPEFWVAEEAFVGEFEQETALSNVAY